MLTISLLMWLTAILKKWYQNLRTVIHNSWSKKLPGVTFENKLKFQKHKYSLPESLQKIDCSSENYTLYGTDNKAHLNEGFLQLSIYLLSPYLDVPQL